MPADPTVKYNYKPTKPSGFFKGLFSTALDFTPIVGDVKGLLEGVQDLKKGNTGMGLLGIAGAVPLVGVAADAAKKGVKAKKMLDPAVHYGDLGYGRDTTLGMMDGGRGTGHFGTGVYFLSPKNNLTYAREGRPAQEIDFSDYPNLFKPSNSREAESLYRSLKEINRMTSHAGYKPDDIGGEAWQKTTKELEEWLLNMPKSFRKGKTLPELLDIAQDIAKKKGPVREGLLYTSKYEETGATEFMRQLGYEGVDVRHLPNYDTGEYGSVIFGETIGAK